MLADDLVHALPAEGPPPAMRRAKPFGFRRIGVVVPVFGHARYVAETIEAAMAARLACPLVVLAIDDGCPSPETRATLSALRARHGADPSPARTLLTARQVNGGLSAARNTGVRTLLSLYGDIDALFFLDADNRIEPYALQSSAATLWAAREADPSIGWAFPDIHAFGLTPFADGVDIRETARADTVFRHLRGNMSEAGSLVARQVFEAGVSYDETMRAGLEDWEFWLSARDAGFSGVRVKDPGFLYRVRPESMVAQSRRETDQILAYMRKKHDRLFARAEVLRAEHEEAPRFLMADLETGTLRATSDPLAPGRPVPLAEFRRLVGSHLRDPHAHDDLPPILIAHQGLAAPANEWPKHLRSLVFEVTKAPLDAPCLIQIEPNNHASRFHGDPRHARKIAERSTALLVLVPVTAIARLIAESPREPGLAILRDTTRMEHWTVPIIGPAPGPAGKAIGPRRVRRLSALLRTVTGLRPARPLAHVSRLHRGPFAADARLHVSDDVCGAWPWPPFPSVRARRARVLLTLSPASLRVEGARVALGALARRLASADLAVSILFDGQTQSLDLDTVFAVIEPETVILDPEPTRALGTFGYLGRDLPVDDPESHAHRIAVARGHEAVVGFGFCRMTTLFGELKGDGLAIVTDMPDALLEHADTPGRLAAYEHAHHAILADEAGRAALADRGVPSARMLPRERIGFALQRRLAG